ncbi:transcriptional regulator [Streptomyces sp. BE147]|uniref:helix-turn-helix transcriptional regulator n=1 Tax=Streptomyces sp. BE147 TaxID=3002524 RepID=UPI002E7A2793|nr:transcriptional regulator [Streptomyces sp. BE147]MEE1739078.1 transcriptional regulator [Streptomyces sp. BE147]
MTDTSARLLNLLSLLQTPREWPGSELAERLDVSARTIRRDIDRLRELGYPVEASRGSVGGYRLVAGAAMPPLLLDDEEAVAIAVGLRAGAGHAIEGVDEASVRALAKLEQVLPARLRHRVSALQHATVPLTRGDGSLIDPQTLTTLASAATGQERLRFTYRKGDGTETKRQVEPYRLVSTGRRWYLVAYDLQREDWRTFRVDRVSEPFATGARFVPRPLPGEDGDDGDDGGNSGDGGTGSRTDGNSGTGRSGNGGRNGRGGERGGGTGGVGSGDAAKFLARSMARMKPELRFDVSFEAPSEFVAARLPAAFGAPEVTGERSCRLRAVASDSLEWLALRLALVDCEFSVHGPPQLVEYVAGLGARLGRAAHPGPDPAPPASPAEAPPAPPAPPAAS